MKEGDGKRFWLGKPILSNNIPLDVSLTHSHSRKYT